MQYFVFLGDLWDIVRTGTDYGGWAWKFIIGTNQKRAFGLGAILL